MPMNRESALGSKNAEVKDPCAIDTQESTSQTNADGVALPSLTGNIILHSNIDGPAVIDKSDGAVGEDIFEEFYASRKELEQSTKPGMKSADFFALPCDRELDGDMEAAIPALWDSGGDQFATNCTVFPEASSNIESSIGNLAMESQLKCSKHDVHAASSPAHGGIEGGISSGKKTIDAGTIYVTDSPLRTFPMGLLLIQTLLKQGRSIRMLYQKYRSLLMFHLWKVKTLCYMLRMLIRKLSWTLGLQNFVASRRQKWFALQTVSLSDTWFENPRCAQLKRLHLNMIALIFVSQFAGFS